MKVLDYLFLMRPTLWFPLWTMFLIGYYKGSITTQGGGGIFLPLVGYTLLMSGVYVLNQLVDIESDKINKKLFLLPEGYITPTSAKVFATVLFLLSWVIVLNTTPVFKVFFLLSMILGILYSLPPFKFKARPILDLLSNAIGYGVLAFCVGWCSYGKFSSSAFLYAVPYFWAVGGVFINTTIPDIEGDRKSNEITTGVLLGERGAYFLAIGFIFCVLISGILVKDWLATIAGGVALPLFILAGIRQRTKECFLSIRMGGAVLAILVGIKFWWFLILLGIIVLGVRLYYRYRFNLTYPKLM